MDDASMTIEDYKAIISQQERHIYNLSQLLEISKSFASTLEAKPVSESLLYTCLGQMHVLAAGIFSLKQMAESLRLSQLYFSVDKGSAGKLSRPCCSRSRLYKR